MAEWTEETRRRLEVDVNAEWFTERELQADIRAALAEIERLTEIRKLKDNHIGALEAEIERLRAEVQTQAEGCAIALERAEQAEAKLADAAERAGNGWREVAESLRADLAAERAKTAKLVEALEAFTSGGDFDPDDVQVTRARAALAAAKASVSQVK